MTHQAKQLHLKDLTDGAVTALFRCCGDETTDQWHTLYVTAETSDQEIQDWLAEKEAVCERQHAARERARGIIKKG